MSMLNDQFQLISQTEPTLLGLLQILIESLEPNLHDVVEFNLYSSGKTGVLVYSRKRRNLDHFQKLFSALELSTQASLILRILLSRIPAEKHAVRLLSKSSLSIFFKIDIPTNALIPLLQAVGLEKYSNSILTFFEKINRPACGVALELSSQGLARLRFYHMACGFDEVQQIVVSGYSIFGFKYFLDEKSISALAVLASSNREIVVNVGVSSKSGCSIKFEFPQINSTILPSLFHLTKSEYNTWRSACQIAQYLERETFSYLGVRFSSTAQRELTFYIDARSLLPRC